MLVIVYGTLKRGYGNNVLLSGSEYVGDCTVHGYKLLDSGFPVAVPDNHSSIRGEIWDIKGDPVTLGRLDRLEGYRENDLDRSMYHRVPIGAIDDETKTYYGEMYVGNPKYWHRSHYSECPNVDGLYEWSRGNSW